ncbi:MAG: BMC domain-containing protein [Hungatella sp.]|jgi:microcompartment protein CcmL/EutN|nr:BMC domain-containing protein [Hungatella sp.]
MNVMGEAIYIIELSSVPVGIQILDQIVKRSQVLIIYAKPICIGKFLIVAGGNVEDVQEAQAAVVSVQEKKLLHHYLLTNAHNDILSYFNRLPAQRERKPGANAVGILETRDASSGFRSLNAALKNGEVRLEQVWLGQFMGGKFCYILTGQVEDITMALEAAKGEQEEKYLVDSRVIPAPDQKTLQYLLKRYEG